MKDKVWLLALLLSVFPNLLLPSQLFAQVVPIKEVFAPDASNYPLEKFMKVAVVQWAPVTPTPINVTPEQAESFKARLRDELAQYVVEASKNGAQWIVTPEFATVGYPDIPELPPEEDQFRSRAEVAPYVETVPGNTTRYFSKLAVELKAYLHVGLAEVDAKTDEYFNTVVVIDPRGDVVAKYRKMNLFKQETLFLSAGKEVTTYIGPFGKVGLAICSDVYHSSPMGEYKLAQVQVLAISTSWANWNSGMSAFISAANQLHATTLAANQNYFPDSGVINPDGSIQSHIRQTTGVAYGFVPLIPPVMP